MSSGRRAVPPGGRRRALWKVADAHERFLASPDEPVGDVRDVVLESWRRSLRLGVDPQAAAAPLGLSDDELQAYRDQHPLATVMPLIRHLLVTDAEDAGHIVAVGDARGRLLWVEGHRALQRRAEQMHFVEGALWSEGGAGTNAPGTALALAEPVLIASAEHFGVGVQPWSCVAAPIRDLRTGEVIGVIDLTGGDDVAGPRTFALVRAAAAAAESTLLTRAQARSAEARRPVAPQRSAPPEAERARLAVLGGDLGSLTLAAPHAARTVQLSRRHTEIVWLLSRAARGLSVQALDAALHERSSQLVTVRAEMARLRRVLDAAGGESLLASRPYRLTTPVATDVDDLRRHLARGAVHKALDLFAGPPLPGSDAPGVVAAREELVAELREAVLATRSAAALERWTTHDAGHDDAAAWTLLETCLPAGSPKRATARAHRLRLA